MTEKELISLGFEKQIEDDEENPFYYYTLDIPNGFDFITQASDEVQNDEWFVEIFEYGRYKFEDAKTLSTLINILN